MNITGLILMKNNGLSIMENTFIFRALNEIPDSHLWRYENKKLWAIRGFDDRTKISDSPYKIKNPRLHGFSKEELPEKFRHINEEMDKLDIPQENRIFLICRVFYNEDVEFSGHAYRVDNTIFIDILKSNRPSCKDWTPDLSFKIQIVNNRPIYSLIDESNFREYIIQICKDILKFDNKAYLDFTKFKDGYFFYHDLSISKTSQ
jgi:hypothetical protein